MTDDFLRHQTYPAVSALFGPHQYAVVTSYTHDNFTIKTQVQTARHLQVKSRCDPAVRRKKSVMLLGDNEPMRGSAAVQMTLTHTNVNGSHTSTAMPR